MLGALDKLAHKAYETKTIVMIPAGGVRYFTRLEFIDTHGFQPRSLHVAEAEGGCCDPLPCDGSDARC